MDVEAPPIILEQLPAARRSLRLAVVTETFPPEVNGVSLSVARVVRGLCERNHEIQLVRPRQDRGDAAGRAGGYHEVLCSGVSIPRYPSLKMGLPAKRALIRQWALRRPDLVHVVTEGPLGWSALQAASQLKLPVCSDFRTNFHSYSQHYGVGWLKKPIAVYLRKFHNRTLLTMVPTEAIRQDLARLGFHNLRVLARGVDTRLFDPLKRSRELRATWGADDDTPVVLHVGRIAPEKNLATLVAAYEAMKAREPRARLVLVGDGPATTSMRQRCPDAVFAGMRTGEDLATHYASGDVFLFPSLTETYGNVTLEAMASGLAIVAFDYAAAAEHLEHGVNALLPARDDATAFVSLAAELATDRTRIREFGARARARAGDLEWGRIIATLESIYFALVQSAPAAAWSLPRGAAGSHV